ncbi:hypothetical protein PtA15_4A124 [Puccinia triticina]|uniref:Uncharacterized protein n=1 Tax=Puccinia triticina TaxID=208348 RepID=A0ABY7CEP5_9BASI|nr:uncharacterized protein PtA15_4A124 [Puccinia triticina]WAQ83676.1 hypothetical protein PtA15_4A124 [Puccinia triticina]
MRWSTNETGNGIGLDTWTSETDCANGIACGIGIEIETGTGDGTEKEIENGTGVIGNEKENENNENKNEIESGCETERRKEIGITASGTGRENEIEWTDGARIESIETGNKTESEAGNGNDCEQVIGKERLERNWDRRARSRPRPTATLPAPPPLPPPCYFGVCRLDIGSESGREVTVGAHRDSARLQPTSAVPHPPSARQVDIELRRASLRNNDHDRRRGDERHSAGPLPRCSPQ